ncbi:lytic transglycosylase domain-containing protein [Oceanibium sediminis]|uniref:lytic transglycosylase domain-containing protein n=1 Tax=Oceanibium sediminis TaxID=2026339 RepID=UPI000DD4E380|nr:lytic transglycosylase domain-containing protein [Oceanibium sediminis]
MTKPLRRARPGRALPRLIFTLTTLAGLAMAPLAQAFQADKLTEALTYVYASNFERAEALAAESGDPIAADIITWHKLRAGDAPWREYVDFLRRNADWPGLPLLQRRAEAQMPAGLPPAEVRAFFAAIPPQSGRGALLLSAALGGEAGAAERVRAWRDIAMSESDRAFYRREYAESLRAHHAVRADNLLWEGRTSAAKEMLDLLGPADAAVARARIALSDRANGVDALIAAIPASRADDPGVAHDRFRWRLAKDRWDDAESLLRERSTSAASLGRPEAWASSRRAIARRAMRDGRPRNAYEIASRHYLSEGANYADLEWLSGYLALTYLEDPGRALRHFENFRHAVETPISLGRAGYWLGRAHERLGNQAEARAAYGFGGTFQTTFYGQLAAERIGLPVDQSIVTSGALPGVPRALRQRTPVRAAELLQAAGDTVTALRFLLHVQESLSPQDSAALAAHALDIGQTAAAVKIAKRVVEDGVIYPDAYYPVTALAREVTAIPPELAMSIARQESELNPRAISPAGARGLMQVMPATAERVAGQLGLPYEQGRLTSDPSYNGQLGSQYLADMLERFDGSILLAAAAYNAGPGRPERWIELYGDPRRPGVDPIDWIEHMPFRETRNYVMRVMESLHVYRARINGRAGPIGLGEALKPR